MNRKNSWRLMLIACAAMTLSLHACSSNDGKNGANGAAGVAGKDGIVGTAGQTCWDLNNNATADTATEDANGDGTVDIADCGRDGQPAVTIGSISGTVKDAGNIAVVGAAITTNPGSGSTTSDGSGSFVLSNVPIGSYAVLASKAGYATFTLANVGVASGTQTSVALVLSATPQIGAKITGTIRDMAGFGVTGATVAVEGQTATTTVAADGTYQLTGVTAGPVYVTATPPVGVLALPSETRSAVWAIDGGTVAVDLTVSGRPSDAATYIGTTACIACHGAFASTVTTVTAYQSSAHARSLTMGVANVVHKSNAALWPALDGPGIDTNLNAMDPVTGVGTLRVYFCNTTTYGYSMQLTAVSAPGAGDCLSNTIIPIRGTYGGEGDNGLDHWDGVGAEPAKNFGRWKQRYLASVTEVPIATGWTYTAGKDRDYLILPVQITQSGTGTPSFAGYKNTGTGAWADRSRTFSRQCSGCHNVGVQLTLDVSNYVTSYGWAGANDPASFNVGCEHCHGPASEHYGNKQKIIMPNLLTAESERQLCGQCHSADAGKSISPSGIFSFPFNQANAAKVGNGQYVPGVYDTRDYIKGLLDLTGFDKWPDGRHGKAHRQQYTMLSFSVHTNNPYEKLACSDCHNVHSGKGGPAKASRQDDTNAWDFYSLAYRNNSLCLSCHAGYGPFASLNKDDVAAMHYASGGTVDKNGAPGVTYTATQSQLSNIRIGAAVGAHMGEKAGMGAAIYDPTTDLLPVGRCSSCHMPKTAKSGGYTYGTTKAGLSALVSGDQASHVFDVIWPSQTAALKKAVGGVDTDIMPNSCGSCHDSARLSGDGL